MAIRMQQRRGTLSQWAAANPVLAAGEIGWESDTNKFKIGDGVNQWDDLQYFAVGGGDGPSLDGYATEAYVDAAIDAAQLRAYDWPGTSVTYQRAMPENKFGFYTDNSQFISQVQVGTWIKIQNLNDESQNIISQVYAIQEWYGNTLFSFDLPPADGYDYIVAYIGTVISSSDLAPLDSPTFTGLTEFQGIVDFSDAVVVGIDALPSQAGNDGKYLTTDGTTASWQAVAAAAPHPFTMIG